MNTNPTWKDWFVFSKKERNAFVFLVSAIALIILAQLFYQPHFAPPAIENLDRKIAGLSVSKPNTYQQQTEITSNKNDEVNASSALFIFNPNTLDEAGFKKLGLRDKTIRTLINYRSKGGQFRAPEDIRKVYGLQKKEADQLIPYIQIPSYQQQNKYSQNNTGYKKGIFVYNHSKPQIININTATVEQWKTLPAIGDALSNRIVKYRDKMGGFTSLEQVKKTYGLSDSAYQVILPYLTFSTNKSAAFNPGFSSKKININTASVDELKANSNIPAEVAEAIIIYRKQHGNYSSVNDIKKIVFINENLYQKIVPYLIVE